MLAESHGGAAVVELILFVGCQRWVSAEVFAVETSLPSQPVDYALDTLLGPLATLTVSVGVVSNGTYQPVASTTGQGPSGTIQMAEALSLDAGDRIGFQVCAALAGLATVIDVTTDGSSLITFTETAP